MKLSGSQKILFDDLLNGMYIIKVKGFKGLWMYKLYSGNMNPVRYLNDRTMSPAFRGLLKTDAKRKMTLNLNAIRQLDGRSYPKRQYKKLITNRESIKG